MKKISFSLRTVPAALLAFCLVAFGLLIPTLGFYWDDWQMIWFNYTTGPAGLFQAFQGDRPFLALTFFLTSLIARPVPLDWQIMGLLTRFGLALSFYWMVRQIWPKAGEVGAWAALLYALYPGFKQQHISVIYTNGFILLALFNLSIGWMALALRTPKRYWLYTILALLSFAFCTFSTEYYVGLELIRPLIIFILLGRSIKNLKPRFWSSVKHWLPYIAIMCVFLIWRVFIFQFPTYHPALIEQTQTNYFSKFTYLLYRIVFDIYQTGWLTWLQSFQFPSLKDFAASSNIASWGISLGALLLALIYLFRLKTDDGSPVGDEKTGISKEFILVGAFTLLVAGWPYWIVNLPIDLYYQYDRFTLSFMLGSALLLTGLIDWALRLRPQKIIAVSVLIAALCGMHFLNANSYRREWETMNDMFWQMTWRAPQVEPNTLFLTFTTPMQYYSDNSLTGPLNLIYAPENHTLNLPYYLAFYDVRVGRSIPEIKPGLAVEQEYRNASFHGNTSDTLVFSYTADYCLRILDPVYDKDLPILPNELKDATPLSNPSGRIIPNPALPASLNPAAFAAEPSHTWCYYFEKADLARQQQKWDEVIKWTEDGLQKGFSPKNTSELLPVIEAYAMTANWDQASQSAINAYQKMPSLHDRLCDTLNRSAKASPLTTEAQSHLDEALHQIRCNTLP
ncbi:MAG: hypothetical protein LWX83_14190 [Anaerolineae bacterium]|nr:hypothetical protein [Anaerolineae bacterium]